MKRQVYILILSEHLGGAEIRFLRLFKILALKEKSIHLAFYHGFLQKVISFHEFADFQKYNDRIIELGTAEELKGKSFNYLYQCLRPLIPKESILHFNQNFPATYPALIKEKTVFTFNENSLSRFSYADHLYFLLSSIRANRVDLLDPAIYRKLKKWLFFKKRSICLTKAGSISKEVEQINMIKREPSVVFSGRFNQQKQVLKYADAIEYIDRSLIQAGILNTKYYLIGDGEEEKKVSSILDPLIKNGLAIQYGFRKDLSEILKKGSIFLSIQKHNNYPSNSLMEAMASGMIPLVTDNGSSRKLAQADFSFYLKEGFNKEELAEKLKEIFVLNEEEVLKMRQKARECIVEEYNVEASASYYLKLYKMLDQ